MTRVPCNLCLLQLNKHIRAPLRLVCNPGCLTSFVIFGKAGGFLICAIRRLGEVISRPRCCHFRPHSSQELGQMALVLLACTRVPAPSVGSVGQCPGQRGQGQYWSPLRALVSQLSEPMCSLSRGAACFMWMSRQLTSARPSRRELRQTGPAGYWPR